VKTQRVAVGLLLFVAVLGGGATMARRRFVIVRVRGLSMAPSFHLSSSRCRTSVA
jgi:uncharacterized protein YabE (DUF348 family)